MSDLFKPYLSDPMVQNIIDELDTLNEPNLNKMIVSVDWIISSLRDYYAKGRVKPVGRFSASVFMSRGMLFLDRAHSTKNIDDIINYVFTNTRTATDKNIIRNIQEVTIPRLVGLGLIELDDSGRTVTGVMPYPVSSKYFVRKNVVGKLFDQQINQFAILASVQDFPVERDQLASSAPRQELFERDHNALSEIDVIRNKAYNGVPYTVAKDYLMTNKESLDVWKAILEASGPVRAAFRDLMVLQGDLGGYISEQDIIAYLGWKPRAIYKMFRRADSLGLSKLTRTLNWEDALIRPIAGSKLTYNFTQLNGAPQILTLTRWVPDSVDILEKLYRAGSIQSDELLNEFNPSTVGKIEHVLTEIGVLEADKINEGLWNVAKNKGCEELLLEANTIAVKSRRISEAKGAQTKLADYAKYLDDKTIEGDSKKLEVEFDKEFGAAIKK